MSCKAKLISLGLVLVYLLSPAGAWSDENSAAFIGLWQGVDNVDGSLRTISIADPDGDGVLEVRAHDTYWTLCDGERGREDTTGTVEDDGSLHTSGRIECLSGDNVAVETIFTPSPGTLVEHVVGREFATLLFRIDR